MSKLPTMITFPPPIAPMSLRGQMALAAPQNTPCALAGTYYIIAGTWEETTVGANYGFVVDPAGRLTYEGPSGVIFAFHGVSDLGIDSALKTEVNYGLYVNGALVPKAQTPHVFSALDKTEGIAIVNFVKLDSGDYLEVWTKSDRAAITVKTQTLSILLFGQYP